jgi:hypothetical protein
MANPARRSGSIHRFLPRRPGPTIAAFRSAPPIPACGVPVEAIDVDTLKSLGAGRLIAASLDGTHLVGTIEWPGALERIAGDGQPAAHTEFRPDGSIRRVVVEMDPREGASKPPCGGDCGCDGCGPAARSPSRFRPKHRPTLS